MCISLNLFPRQIKGPRN